MMPGKSGKCEEEHGDIFFSFLNLSENTEMNYSHHYLRGTSLFTNQYNWFYRILTIEANKFKP